MTGVPKTVTGLAPFIMVIFVITLITFTQQYGWFDWTRWLEKSN